MNEIKAGSIKRKLHLTHNGGNAPNRKRANSKINPSYLQSETYSEIYCDLHKALLQTGVWIQCSECEKWRHLPSGTDPSQIPTDWKCSMNHDKKFSDCSIQQSENINDVDSDIIYSEYSVGSLVWARTPGFPWWPGMIDIDMKTMNFYWTKDKSQEVTHYNVTYIGDNCSHSKVNVNNIQRFTAGQIPDEVALTLKYETYRGKWEESVQIAEDAYQLPVSERARELSYFYQTYQSKKLNGKNIDDFNKVVADHFVDDNVTNEFEEEEDYDDDD